MPRILCNGSQYLYGVMSVMQDGCEGFHGGGFKRLLFLIHQVAFTKHYSHQEAPWLLAVPYVSIVELRHSRRNGCEILLSSK